MNFEAIKKAAQDYRPAMAKFLRDMIAIPSESCQEEGVVRRIAQEMESLGYDKVEFDKLGNVIGWMGKVQQGERAVIAQEDGRPGQGRGAQDQDTVHQAAAALAADGQEIGQQAQHQRQEHRQKEKDSVHMVHLLTEWTR